MDKIESVVTELPEPSGEEQNRLQRFTLNHPRTAKVVGIVAITAATMGAVSVIKNRKQIAAELKGEESDDSFDSSSEIA